MIGELSEVGGLVAHGLVLAGLSRVCFAYLFREFFSIARTREAPIPLRVIVCEMEIPLIICLDMPDDIMVDLACSNLL